MLWCNVDFWRHFSHLTLPVIGSISIRRGSYDKQIFVRFAEFGFYNKSDYFFHTQIMQSISDWYKTGALENTTRAHYKCKILVKPDNVVNCKYY